MAKKQHSLMEMKELLARNEATAARIRNNLEGLRVEINRFFKFKAPKASSAIRTKTRNYF
jgi:hypothetical protein